MADLADPSDETRRLDAVRRYEILDSPPDGSFDRITALATRLFDVPISIVSIVDHDRIWFKSRAGVDVDQIDREPGLCASAILQAEPWLVSDARGDPRTLANPLVAGELGLQFYAGVPLTTSDGYNLGTLCIIDVEPRDLTRREVDTLSDLATLVMDQLELRLAARRTVSLQAELRRSAEATASTLQRSLLPPVLPTIPGLDLAARYHAAHHDLVGGDFYDVVSTDAGCAVVVGDVVGKGTYAATLTGTARWALRTATLAAWSPATAMRTLNDVLVRSQETADRYITVALARLRPQATGFELTTSIGGHPHPLVVRRDGRVEPVGRTGPLVGWRSDASYTDVAVDLEPGDACVLYTDGLLEAIAGRSATSDAALRGLLAAHAGSPAGQIADALDAALGPDLKDDAALLVVVPR